MRQLRDCTFTSLTCFAQFLLSCRKVLIFTQQSIAALSMSNPETGVKLYLEAALITDKFGKQEKEMFGPISYEFISQSFALYEANSGDSRLQTRCIKAIVGTLVACRCLSKEDYEGLIMKTAQYAAKMLKKPDQCEMVALCSNLFYVVGEDVSWQSRVLHVAFPLLSADMLCQLLWCYLSGFCYLQQPTAWLGMPSAGVEIGRCVYYSKPCKSGAFRGLA